MESTELQLKFKEIQKGVEEMENLIKDFHQEKLVLNMANITQKRQLVHLFITISSGIIGALLVFERSALIAETGLKFVAFGLILFLILILYGFYYLVHILTKEGSQIDAASREFFDELTKVQKKERAFLKEPTNEKYSEIMSSRKQASKNWEISKKDFQDKHKKFSPTLFIMFALFFFGLISLALSIFSNWWLRIFQKLVL